MDANAIGVALLIFLVVLLLNKYNIKKQVSLALFLTGLLQFVIQGYADILTIAFAIVICGAIVSLNHFEI